MAKAVIAADPAAAEERRTQTEKQARVELQPEASGVTSMLAGRDLPVAESVAAANRITALAAALRRDGATAGIDLLRARVYLGLLLGRPVAAPAPETEPQPQPAATPNAGLAADPDAGPTVGADTELETTPTPVTSTQPAADPRTGLPAGLRLVPADGNAITWPVIGGHTPPSGQTAPSGDIDPPGGALPAASVNLTVPLTTWLGLTAEPGDLTGYGPVTAATAGQILATTNPATRWCLTIHSDNGRVLAHGCAAKQPPPLRAAKDPPGEKTPTAASWNLTISAQPLATGRCDHSRESARYQPPLSLRHLIEVRDLTCSFPGCRRPAVRCDKDHTIPFDRGGKTCECNLAPLCRFHHKVKQAAGWRLTQPAPGEFIWITPAGWQYSNKPDLLR